MSHFLPHKKSCHMPTVVHNIVCQHQIEIAVWPSEAEVYFRDERYTDPINTQVRFDAVVYNAPTSNVQWVVRNMIGGTGAGSIDPTGLYTAPPKGYLPSALTDIIIATATDDPLRKAFAKVTLIGVGPEPVPEPKIEVFPQQIYLYYPSGHHNNHIDPSNTMQMFHTIIRNSASNVVNWYRDTGSGYFPVGGSNPWHLYKVSGTGGNGTEVKIKAELQGSPGVKDEARVIQINYSWPGIT